MKSRLLIYLSALALLVLLIVQYIFINQTYSTKRDILDARYEGTIRAGLSSLATRDISFEFDSILYVMDNLAVEYLFSDPDTVRMKAITEFQEILSGYSEAEVFIRRLLGEAGMDTAFSYMLQIQELVLKDMDMEFRVRPDSALLQPPSRDALMVGSHTHVRNFFQITYYSYVDFRKHTQMVLKEMWVILLMTIIMLLGVFSVFFLTLRNMLRQKRLSEMKTDFINNMTHELKTPLSTISVASSSLGNPALYKQEEKVEELSHLIKKQNRHLSELIDRILDINIWERDQVRIRMEETGITAWINTLVEAFRLKHPKVVMELNNEVADLHMFIDEVHMSTAVNNLLSNAVRYGKDPCRIRLRVFSRDEDLHILVEDNGPGIRRDELRHVFEKFFRGQESKKRVIRGLGLGLYYVKQITEAHGGQISARSEPGKGAAFEIKIPLKNGHTAG